MAGVTRVGYRGLVPRTLLESLASHSTLVGVDAIYRKYRSLSSSLLPIDYGKTIIVLLQDRGLARSLIA